MLIPVLFYRDIRALSHTLIGLLITRQFVVIPEIMSCSTVSNFIFHLIEFNCVYVFFFLIQGMLLHADRYHRAVQ